MNKLREKTMATLLIAVFLLSAFIVAVPVSATGTIELYDVNSGSAEWRKAEHDVKLYVVDGATDWAEVSIPVDIALKDISELKFGEMIQSYTTSGWDVNVVLGIDLNGNGVFEADLPKWHGTHLVADLHGDTFAEMDGKLGSLTADVSWTVIDALTMAKWWTPNAVGNGLSGSGFSFNVPPGLYCNFADLLLNIGIGGPTWDTNVPNTDVRVKCVKLLIGGSGSWMGETAYVDDVTINLAPYDFPFEAGEPSEVTVTGTGTIESTDADTIVSYKGATACTITTQDLTEENFAKATFSAVGSYVDVKVDDPEAVTELMVRVGYDPEHIGGLDQNRLIMYWYDGSNWSPCSDTGRDTNEHYIWATINVDTVPNLSQMMGTPFSPGDVIGFDADYYMTGDHVILTVTGVSEDPIRTETILVPVKSDSDVTGIAVVLTETGVDTGIFTGTFPLVALTPEPGVNQLGVENGDTITATYTNEATARVDDHPGAPTVEVSVDKDPAPTGTLTFTLTFSEDMDTTVPPSVTFGKVSPYTAQAVSGSWTVGNLKEWKGTATVPSTTLDDLNKISVSDAVDPAGNVMVEDISNTFVIDTTAPNAPVAAKLVVSMNAPGTDDTIAGSAGAVEASATVNVYSDEDCTDLIESVQAAEDGSFSAINIGDNTNGEVWVTATDAAGNEGPATSMLNDITAPEITSVTWAAAADPVRTGETITVTLVGEVGCVATFDIGTKATNQPMTETDGTYVGVYTIVSGDDGTLAVTGHLTDAAGNTQLKDADDSVIIVTDEVDPVIESTIVTYPVGVHSAREGDDIIIQAIVTDDLTGVETVDSDGFISAHVGDTWTLTLTITDPTPGTYEALVTATDFAGNDATKMVTYKVTTSLTGYNVELVEGWNLVSLPLIPTDSSIETVLGDATSVTDKVWSYDASETRWYVYSPTEPELSDLSSMVDGKGYWVKTTDATTLVNEGVEVPLPPQTPASYAVVPGWNLIGFKETDPMTASTYLAGIVGKYVNMYTYEDGAFQQILSGDPLVPGMGYWLAVTGEGYIYP